MKNFPRKTVALVLTVLLLVSLSTQAFAKTNISEDPNGITHIWKFPNSTTKSATVDISNVIKFEDVKDGAWYAEAVYEARAKGLIMGTSETTFNPDGWLLKNQWLTMLGRLDTKKGGEQHEFPNAIWYYSMWKWGCEEGIVDYADNPEEYITREMFATYAGRFLKGRQGYFYNGAQVRRQTFVDIEDCKTHEGREYIEMLQKLGLLIGDNHGRVNPNGKLTRAEAATFLIRLQHVLLNLEWEGSEGQKVFSRDENLFISFADGHQARPLVEQPIGCELLGDNIVIFCGDKSCLKFPEEVPNVIIVNVVK